MGRPPVLAECILAHLDRLAGIYPLVLGLFFLFLGSVSCGTGGEGAFQGNPFTCDTGEADWQALVLAPPGPLVYPKEATWYGPNGDSRPVDPKRLLPGGDDVPVEPGILVLDFGQNVAGFMEMGFRDAQGISFDLRFSEAHEFIWDTAQRFYEMLTHRQPFKGESTMDMLKQIFDHNPPEPMEVIQGIPEEINELVMSMIEEKPEDRPPAGEVLELLKHFSSIIKEV